MTGWGNDEPWVAGARCTETDPEVFFPEKGEKPKSAKQVCLGCEVRAECLDYALRNREPYGVWGGTTERERRRILAARGHDPGTLDTELDHDDAA